MLYLIHGTDIGKIKSKQNELVAVMQKKQPDVSLYKINEENASWSTISELISSQGLFLSKYIVVLDRLLGSDSKEDVTLNISENIINNLKDFEESNHAWIIVEESPSKTLLKKIEKFIFKVFDVDEGEGETGGNVRSRGFSGGPSKADGALIKKTKPTSFAFADALFSKNKALAWQEFQKLKEAGVAGEEIHGVMWWQLKSMFLTMMSKSAAEAGISPFVFTKSKKMCQTWDIQDLHNLSNQIVEIYHKSHRGECDLMIEIERVVLGDAGTQKRHK